MSKKAKKLWSRVADQVAGLQAIFGSAAAGWGRAIFSTARQCWRSLRTLCGRSPAVRQQFFDSTVQVRGQPGEDILQVSLRLVPIELGGLKQAHHGGGPLAGQLASHEEPIPSPKGNLGVILPMSGRR
jgi:hypothetical protein